MQSVVSFLEGKLKLKVNREKSAVASSSRRKFLGFSFYFTKNRAQIRVHPKSYARLKDKIKGITGRSNAKSSRVRIDELNKAIHGWVNYFRIADMKTQLQELAEGINPLAPTRLKNQQNNVRNIVRNG